MTPQNRNKRTSRAHPIRGEASYRPTQTPHTTHEENTITGRTKQRARSNTRDRRDEQALEGEQNDDRQGKNWATY